MKTLVWAESLLSGRGSAAAEALSLDLVAAGAGEGGSGAGVVGAGRWCGSCGGRIGGGVVVSLFHFFQNQPSNSSLLVTYAGLQNKNNRKKIRI